MTEPTIPANPLQGANDRIRDAAKWLIGSSAAVAAALIAGSQLSSIGKLAVELPTSVTGARLWIAVVGAVGGLVAVVYVLWTAVRLLPEVQVTISALVKVWSKKNKPDMAAVVTFLKENPWFLQGYNTPGELVEARNTLVARLTDDLNEAAAADLQAQIGDYDARIRAVENRASAVALQTSFKLALRRLLWATIGAALGILAFAWAANPPAAPTATATLSNANLSHAFLRDTNLVNAVLDHSNLTDADLTGADLSGASIVGVIWHHTMCPDGRNSDRVGHTCAGHLHP